MSEEQKRRAPMNVRLKNWWAGVCYGVARWHWRRQDRWYRRGNQSYAVVETWLTPDERQE
jgi:hypothetical protein